MPHYNIGPFPADNRGRYEDGKGKGWMAVGRMSLTRLRFLDSRGIPLAGSSSENANNINVPSAIHLSPNRLKPPLLMLLQCDNYMP